MAQEWTAEGGEKKEEGALTARLKVRLKSGGGRRRDEIMSRGPTITTARPKDHPGRPRHPPPSKGQKSEICRSGPLSCCFSSIISGSLSSSPSADVLDAVPQRKTSISDPNMAGRLRDFSAPIDHERTVPPAQNSSEAGQVCVRHTWPGAPSGTIPASAGRPWGA